MPYLISLIFVLAFPAFASKPMTDTEVRQAIIRDSIAAFQGICPCPYSIHPDGKQCGHRSAFSRGVSGSKNESMPICYEINISLKMIEEFRQKSVSVETNPVSK